MASGYELPAKRAPSELTAQAVTSLFHEHRPPLVIKSDNDSLFNGAQTQATLLDWRACQTERLGIGVGSRRWSFGPLGAQVPANGWAEYGETRAYGHLKPSFGRLRARRQRSALPNVRILR